MKKNIFLFLNLFSLLIVAQNTNYFKRLQKEKAISDPRLKWTVIGPGTSGYSEELIIHPSNENVMFLNYDMGNAYGSWNKGKTWTTLNDFDGKGSVYRPHKISFSKTEPNFGIMKNRKSQLYKTYDYGKTWIDVPLFPSRKKFSDVIIDPNDIKTWYVGGGQFWDVKNMHRNLKNPHGTQTNYTQYGWIYKTTDGGLTWRKIMDNISEDLDIGRIIIDPRNSKKLYVLTNYGFYTSSNGGNTWKESKAGLPYNDVRDLRSYYNEDTGEFNLYLLLQTHYQKDGESTKAIGGVYKSADNGNNWESITGNLEIDYTQINYQRGHYYYKTIAFWFGISEKEAKEKYPKLPQKTLSVFNRLVVNPNNPDEIYISNNTKHDKSFGPGGLFKTNDGGENWIVAARIGKYWKEEKDKEYWEKRNNPLGSNMKLSHLSVILENVGHSIGFRDLQINSKGEVFCVFDQQLIISKDGGENWSQIDDTETTEGSGHWIGHGNSNLPGFGVCVDTKEKGKYLFASEEHGVWKSTTDGNLIDPDAVAMEQIEGQSKVKKANKRPLTSATTISVDPNDPKIYYAIANRQSHAGTLRKSIDAGKTWFDVPEKPIVEFKRNGVLHIFSHIVDKKDSNRMFFTIPSQTQRGWHTSKWIRNGHLRMKHFEDFGIYKSVDGGKTWKVKNSGLPKKPNVTQVTYDKEYKNMYAALGTSLNGRSGGLYVSKNNGNSWKKNKIPLGIKTVNFVEVDQNGTVYIACGEGQAEIGQGGVFRSTDKGKKWKKIFDMPHTNKVKVSPLDPKMIGVVVAPGRKVKFINSGIYLSRDAGKTWKKHNYGLGQVDKITDFEFDPFDKNVFWSSSHGSGFAKGVFK